MGTYLCLVYVLAQIFTGSHGPQARDLGRGRRHRSPFAARDRLVGVGDPAVLPAAGVPGGLLPG
eukprot:6587550-Pyramimonas_sp.AAC.1